MVLVDRSDLKSDYDEWPRLARRTWSSPSDISNGGGHTRVVLAGMGGSGITGEIISDYSREVGSKICFETLKDYHLPAYVGNESLVIGMSSSGNTEETLSVLSESYEKGIDAWTFGSGGLVQKLSLEKWSFSFTKTEMLKVPRSSFPGLFFHVLKALDRSGILKLTNDEVQESLLTLETIQSECSLVNKRNRALAFAKTVAQKNSSPVIYSSSRTRAAGLRARQSFNENAKLHLFNGTIPEFCHNDIVAWDLRNAAIKNGSESKLRGDPTSVILLRLHDDPIEIATRFNIVEEIVRKNGGKVLEVPHVGKSYLSRILSMIYFLDYCSYYMAIIRGIDPIKTPSIDRLKSELARRLDYVARLK
jgi:glucose/mannose-6-phosphate isomerase